MAVVDVADDEGKDQRHNYGKGWNVSPELKAVEEDGSTCVHRWGVPYGGSLSSRPPSFPMSLFNAFSAPAQKPANSLFGNFGQQNQQQQQQQQQPQQQNQQQTPNTLFGGQPAGSNIFGANTTTNATLNSSQPAQPATGLFGNSTVQPQQQAQAQQPPQSTGLFSQPAASGSSNLFGASSNLNTSTNAAAQPAQGTTGLFGANTQTQGGGLNLGFGASQPASNFGGFGSSTSSQPNPTTSSLFGQSQLQPQQQQQSTASVGPLFNRTTKFNDLPEDVRKKFEQIDTHIQGRVQIGDELKQTKLGEEPQKGSEQIRIVHKDLVYSINKLRSDIASMRELRSRMDQAVQDTIATTRIIDAFKSPQSAQQSMWLKNYSGFPLE
ncbi:hypothetical protein EW145_g2412 [Phellinidium pouzarii]|uniref:Nucleoporin Nup54 alpha-helical domain-containing protein n=1 Tax=Phellinidium pouzarii TaxID=167371 RepID=A0A4S4LBE8_9AGAM|nr:hypothetical protein EW145_g2412 [Phellinidium pouzarii]